MLVHDPGVRGVSGFAPFLHAISFTRFSLARIDDSRLRCDCVCGCGYGCVQADQNWDMSAYVDLIKADESPRIVTLPVILF